MRSYTVWRVGSLVILLAALVILTAISITAQTPTTGPILRLTGTSENVSGAPDMIRIDLLRWSTDAERDQLIAAWNLTPAPAAPAAEGAARGGGGRGGGRGGAGRGGAGGGDAAAGNAAAGNAAAGDGAGACSGRWCALLPLPVDEVAAAAVAAAAADEGRLPRQLLQRPKPLWPAALEKAPTVGYLWSSEAGRLCRALRCKAASERRQRAHRSDYRSPSRRLE